MPNYSGAVAPAPVEPAGGSGHQSPPASASPESLQAITQVLGELVAIDPRSNSGLRPLRLVDAISRLGDRTSQAGAIDAYWGLFQSIARHRFAVEKVQLVQAIPQPNDDSDRALLEAAVFQAEAEGENEQQAVLAAQYQLLRAGAIPWDGLLPWPSDLPLVSAYRTNFEAYYGQRSAPLQVRFIHQSLPGQLRLVEKRFHAVAASEAAVDTMMESYKRGRGSLTQLLDTIGKLGDARRGWIAAVVDYNGSIAEYSLVTVGVGLGPQTLVSTLIKSKSTSSSGNLVNISPDVRQASGEGPRNVEGSILR